jgi:hypothetical protein
MISDGSVGTFCSKTTLPASSTTHTDVSFTDTSRPTKCAISSLLPRCSRVTRPRYIPSPQKGMRAQHPSLSRSRRDTPSSGRFDSLTRGHPNGGNAAQTRRSGRPGRTAESGGIRSFADEHANGTVEPGAAIRVTRVFGRSARCINSRFRKILPAPFNEEDIEVFQNGDCAAEGGFRSRAAPTRGGMRRMLSQAIPAK